MKKIIIVLTFMLSTFAFSQVGIGTNTPNTNAILDLTATDKALLLPRVANTASIAVPVNGMIIYDLSSNCVKGYENGAWSGCISSSSGSGGGGFTPSLEDAYVPSEIQVKQMSFVVSTGEAYYEARAVTTDGKLYGWGRNFYSSITNGVTANPSYTSGPVYAPSHINHPGFDGIVSKVSTQGNTVAVLTTTGLVFAHGSPTYPGWFGSDKFSSIISGYNGTNYNLFPQSPNGVGWKDIGVSSFRFYLIDNNGAAFWTGMVATNGTNTAVSSIQPIPHPISGKKFEKVIPASNGYVLYLIDEDGKLWASGENTSGQLGKGNTTTSNINSLSQVQFNPTTSLKVVDVIYGYTNKPAVAILEDGSAYVWSNTSKLNNILAPANISTALTTAVPLPLPTGATKFYKVGFGSTYILALTDEGLFEINTSTNWNFRAGTKGFVDMIEENAGHFNDSSRGAHFLIDPDNKVWIWGQATFQLFTPTTDFIFDCNTGSSVISMLPKRILNGNAITNPNNYCTTPTLLAPFPEN